MTPSDWYVAGQRLGATSVLDAMIKDLSGKRGWHMRKADLIKYLEATKANVVMASFGDEG
jgi:hypothetical protein